MPINMVAEAMYTGELTCGMRHGRGTQYYADGGLYEGEWSDDTFHGEGCITWADGAGYKGGFANGKRNGQGTVRYEDVKGSSNARPGNVFVEMYSGFWKDDMREGFGDEQYSDGSKYAGHWSMDKRNGQGTLHHDNVTYTGEWKNDDFDGKGIVQGKNDEWRFDGYFAHGRKHGKGTYVHISGKKYIGYWVTQIPVRIISLGPISPVPWRELDACATNTNYFESRRTACDMAKAWRSPRMAYRTLAIGLMASGMGSER